MAGLRSLRGLVVALSVAGVAGVAATAWFAGTSVTQPGAAASTKAIRRWAQDGATGNVKLTGQVPLAVAHGTAGYVRPHPPAAELKVNFGLPIRDRSSLDTLIAQEARTHRYLTRGQLYARFSPSPAQVDALSQWLQTHGFRITHVGLDRLAITAVATTAVVQRTLHVQINDYIRQASTFHSLQIAPYQFYANTTAPTVPARLGVQSVSGLSDVDRFFSEAQLSPGGPQGTKPTNVRSGGYFPADLRSLYDVAGHGYDGTGQTLGFTLWGAGERQAAMTAFSTATGDQLITVDTPCTGNGNAHDAELLRHAVGRGRPPAEHPRERKHEQPVRRQRGDRRSTSSRPTGSRRTRR